MKRADRLIQTRENIKNSLIKTDNDIEKLREMIEKISPFKNSSHVISLIGFSAYPGTTISIHNFDFIWTNLQVQFNSDFIINNINEINGEKLYICFYKGNMNLIELKFQNTLKFYEGKNFIPHQISFPNMERNSLPYNNLTFYSQQLLDLIALYNET